MMNATPAFWSEDRCSVPSMSIETTDITQPMGFVIFADKAEQPKPVAMPAMYGLMQAED